MGVKGESAEGEGAGEGVGEVDEGEGRWDWIVHVSCERGLRGGVEVIECCS